DAGCPICLIRPLHTKPARPLLGHHPASCLVARPAVRCVPCSGAQGRMASRPEKRRIESPDGDYLVWEGLVEAGFPTELPALPAPVESLFDPPVTGLWRLAIDFARTEGPRLLLDHQPLLWG